MLGFLTRRVLYGIFTLWVLSIVSFLVITLPPGDFVDMYVETLVGEAGVGTPAGDKIEEVIRAEYGLDKPVMVQYGKWMLKVVRGNFGISVEFNRPVLEVVSDKLLLTVIVAVATIVLTWFAAIPIGIYSAVRHHSIEDYSLTFLGFLGLAIPDFLLALMLMWIGYFYFDFSVGGLFTREYAGANVPWTMGKVVDLLAHLWIPAIVLGTSGTAAIIRIMRANLLDELSKPYVVTARAKGLHEWKAVMK